MTAIKFRAWDKRRKSMEIVDRLTFMFETKDGILTEVLDLEPPVREEPRRVLFPEDCELMQFTGLIDKNGKEIYEGDVVAYNVPVQADEDGNIDWEGVHMRIEWDAEKARFQTPFSDAENLPGQHGPKNMVVVGNIYENPELFNL